MTPLDAIIKKILSRLRPPLLARVDKSYIKQGQGGYCLDGTVLRPGSLQDTGEILKEVPINPIWAGKNGQGIYCPPERGQIAIINFLSFNSAWPFFDGIWGEEYTPADGEVGKLVITDGKGAAFTMNGDGLFSLANQSASLRSLLEDLCDELKNLTMTDPLSGILPVAPSSLITIEALKNRMALLLEKSV